MDVAQTIHDEAAYIAESFGLPYVVALNVTLANAKKAARARPAAAPTPAAKTITVKTNAPKKKSKKRVDRR